MVDHESFQHSNRDALNQNEKVFHVETSFDLSICNSHTEHANYS